MDGWTIYWILKLDVLGDLCGAICMLSFVSIAASACTFLFWKEKGPHYRKELTEDGSSTEYFINTKKLVLGISKKCLITCIILFFISLPPATLLPTTKQACVIYVLPKIADNTHVQEIPNNISKIVNEKLAEWIDDMKGTKTKTETK